MHAALRAAALAFREIPLEQPSSQCRSSLGYTQDKHTNVTVTLRVTLVRSKAARYGALASRH